MIDSKKGKEKIKILIIGAGVGIFSEQIRQAFGNKVKVYSTGLSKKAVKEYRKNKFLDIQKQLGLETDICQKNTLARKKISL